MNRVRDLREDHDLKQKELTQILGISQRTYSHYENGTRKIPLDILVALPTTIIVPPITCLGGQIRTNSIEICRGRPESSARKR